MSLEWSWTQGCPGRGPRPSAHPNIPSGRKKRNAFCSSKLSSWSEKERSGPHSSPYDGTAAGADLGRSRGVGHHLSSRVRRARSAGQGKKQSSSSPSASGLCFCDSEQAAFLFSQCFKAAFVFECQRDLSVEPRLLSTRFIPSSKSLAFQPGLDKAGAQLRAAKLAEEEGSHSSHRRPDR